MHRIFPQRFAIWIVNMQVSIVWHMIQQTNSMRWLPIITHTPHILDFTKYRVEKYARARHLYWDIWGMISVHVNKIGFKYKEYAEQRFQQYWSRKTSIESSNGSSQEDNGEQAATLTSNHKPVY
ncbi:probable choline kinase 3 [Vigna angularis]|uniref:probable choline kinase 3 n=1 Tax=Phaseolus angularis TaxID=3914 RepID=UPI0022B437CD|nr:probable choline kinase 3 [Vigna angularis]XP_052723856.1 probable choline kinase 3 [Vigna angularis]XP_052723858.1 probable choline kinase 3 [Vigna angularis]